MFSFHFPSVTMNKLVLCALLVLAVVAMSDARRRPGLKRGGRGGHGGEISASEKSFNGERAGLKKGNRGRLVSKRFWAAAVSVSTSHNLQHFRTWL